MDTTVCLYKKIGETPLMCLHRLREHNALYKEATLSYAGRLDPMAEGLLLVMVNEGNVDREQYLSLDKTYTCEILFDVATDTHDVLGIVRDFVNKDTTVQKATVVQALQSFVGTRTQQYPVYSSRPVQGKPLFRWAREGKSKDVIPPNKTITIHRIHVDGFETIPVKVLQERIHQKLATVQGDFRQQEVRESWDRYFSFIQKKEYLLAKITIECSSGTYVRLIADQLGKKLGTSALAFHIKRIKIGDFDVEDTIL